MINGAARGRRTCAARVVARADGATAARLGERWRVGDERLLRAVVRWSNSKLAPRLASKYRGCLSPTDAEDIAADALVRAWENRASFDRRKGTLSGWLWTIGNHPALDELRGGWHARRDLATAENDKWHEHLPDSHPAEEIEGAAAPVSEIQPEVLQVMTECLSNKELAVLLAEAYSRDAAAADAALAAELDVSRSTLRVLRLRGKRKLRPELERRGLAPKGLTPPGGENEHADAPTTNPPC